MTPRFATIAFAFALAWSHGDALPALDWPTYRHDNQRSGITAEGFELPLREIWSRRGPNLPAPAWPGPARTDFYTAAQVPMKPRQAFDEAFQTSIAAGALVFGSSADDTVTCLDAARGRERWSFTADGAVRFAPTIADGRVIFGADDGSVYCLSAADGALRWKYSAAGEGHALVPSDGRFVSPWCVRSGVLVDGGVAYFSAGFFPDAGVYVCAIDAASGADRGAGLWKLQRKNDISLQGYGLLSATKVYFPAGRSSPYVFNRGTGALLGQFAPQKDGSRGTFALLANERLVVGPAKREGATLEEYDANSPGRDRLAVFQNGNAMVVAAEAYYVLTDTTLSALRRADRGVSWTKPVALPHALILAGDALIAGGDGEVAAFAAASGARLWAAAVEGKAHGLAVADGMLFVSTDRGAIHAFASLGTIDPRAFVRGDANQDGALDIGDVLAILFRLYRGAALACEDHADLDDNGKLEHHDALRLLLHLFLQGPAPAAPFPQHGLDPSADAFACGGDA